MEPKRQGIFVPYETYIKILKIQEWALRDGRTFRKNEIIIRLLDHDPIIMKYYNKLKDEH